MKKFIVLLTLCIIASGLSNAQALEPEKYEDIKNMIISQCKILEEYIKGCENVKEAKDVVVLLTKYKNGCQALLPDLKALMKKYGSLEKVIGENPPENLKPDLKKMEELTQQLFGASIALGKYKEDPDVKKAQEEVNKVRQEINRITNPKKEGEEEE
ncbi:MAG: hypothetical protein KAT34_09830 [Candidatus Aminicenantes bacterium]|nr:hypothetical protein [Candidatus Aminicenantes bacterium]